MTTRHWFLYCRMSLYLCILDELVKYTEFRPPRNLLVVLPERHCCVSCEKRRDKKTMEVNFYSLADSVADVVFCQWRGPRVMWMRVGMCFFSFVCLCGCMSMWKVSWWSPLHHYWWMRDFNKDDWCKKRQAHGTTKSGAVQFIPFELVN